MEVCDICFEMGTNENCENCRFGNPCLDCIHYKNNDCIGQCGENNIIINIPVDRKERKTQ